MTVDEAKALRAGDWVHAQIMIMSDGSPWRAKVTSVKRWKREPDRVEIGLKHGLYAYGKITNDDLEKFQVGDRR